MPLWQWAQVQEVLFELDDGARVSRCVVRLMTLGRNICARSPVSKLELRLPRTGD